MKSLHKLLDGYESAAYKAGIDFNIGNALQLAEDQMTCKLYRNEIEELIEELARRAKGVNG